MLQQDICCNTYGNGSCRSSCSIYVGCAWAYTAHVLQHMATKDLLHLDSAHEGTAALTDDVQRRFDRWKLGREGRRNRSIAELDLHRVPLCVCVRVCACVREHERGRGRDRDIKTREERDGGEQGTRASSFASKAFHRARPKHSFIKLAPSPCATETLKRQGQTESTSPIIIAACAVKLLVPGNRLREPDKGWVE